MQLLLGHDLGLLVFRLLGHPSMHLLHVLHRHLMLLLDQLVRHPVRHLRLLLIRLLVELLVELLLAIVFKLAQALHRDGVAHELRIRNHLLE